MVTHLGTSAPPVALPSQRSAPTSGGGAPSGRRSAAPAERSGPLTVTTGQWAALAAGTTTGQWFTSERGTRWWFDSGSVALDLAHTAPFCPATDPGVHVLRPVADAAGLDAWLAARLACAPATDRDLTDAVGLREVIGRLALAAATGRRVQAADVDVLNLIAAMPDVAPRLDGGTRQAGRTLPAPRQALASFAREAVAVLAGQAGRVRLCDADDCGLVYVDTSRGATRRWCSMDRCGNRSKVRAHRARLAAAGQE